MSQLPLDPDSQSSDPDKAINQQASNTSIGGGMQAAQGKENILVQGNRNQFIQIFLSLFPGREPSKHGRHNYILLIVIGLFLFISTSALIAKLFIPTDSYLKVVDVTQTLPIKPSPSPLKRASMRKPDLQNSESTSQKPHEVSLSDELHRYQILDIKLRNTGEKVTILKKARFQVLKIERVSSQSNWGNTEYFGITHSYKVRLPKPLEKKPPYTLIINISQSVKPNEGDRFDFDFRDSEEGYNYAIGNDNTRDNYQAGEYHEEYKYLYLIKVTLIADEDSKEIALPNNIVIYK